MADHNALTCPACGLTLQRESDTSETQACPACDVSLTSTEPSTGQAEESSPAESVSQSALTRYLFYTLSVPERTVRSGIAAVAGAARETAAVLVPQSFQSSKTYEIMVGGSLKFLCEGIGNVASQETEEVAQEDFLARKAVGNFVELTGLATLHLSPIWLFAIVSDIAYGSQTYVKELAAELQAQGVIAEDSRVHHIDDLLLAIQKSTGEAASLVDTPPLSTKDLRESLSRTRTALREAEVSKILPETDLKSFWASMKDVAAKEDVSLLSISSAVTMQTINAAKTISAGSLTGLRVAGGLFNRNILSHYRESLQNVRERGLYPVLQEVSAPYIAAVWHNYAPDSPTWTGEFLSGRAWSKLRNGVSGWWAKRKAKQDAAAVLESNTTAEQRIETDSVRSADDQNSGKAESEEGFVTLPEEQS